MATNIRLEPTYHATGSSTISLGVITGSTYFPYQGTGATGFLFIREAGGNDTQIRRTADSFGAIQVASGSAAQFGPFLRENLGSLELFVSGSNVNCYLSVASVVSES
jgi:hypothetical protein